MFKCSRSKSAIKKRKNINKYLSVQESVLLCDRFAMRKVYEEEITKMISEGNVECILFEDRIKQQ